MKKKSFWHNDGVQSLVSSLICIVLGLVIGYIVLLVINAEGATEAMLKVIKNFLKWNNNGMKINSLGNTLVKTAPLLMCSLSILFAYKVGLFNIGAAGQYVAGACAGLYAAFELGWSWWACMLVAAVAGALLGVISGLLKAYCNVNEVISGIMLNWIALYTTNMILSQFLTAGRKDTPELNSKAEYARAIIPQIGLGKLFNGNTYVGLAMIISLVFAVAVWIILTKTKFGYELKATGYNKNAAKYAGMAEKRNIIVTLGIGGMLAGLGAALLYLTNFAQWDCNQTSVPAMGFNGIAAAFLGGLNPIGAIFSSFFIQHITDGGSNVDLTKYCAQISDLISAIIIYLCGFVGFMKYLINKRLSHKSEMSVNANAETSQKEVNANSGCATVKPEPAGKPAGSAAGVPAGEKAGEPAKTVTGEPGEIVKPVSDDAKGGEQ